MAHKAGGEQVGFIAGEEFLESRQVNFLRDAIDNASRGARGRFHVGTNLVCGGENGQGCDSGYAIDKIDVLGSDDYQVRHVMIYDSYLAYEVCTTVASGGDKAVGDFRCGPVLDARVASWSYYRNELVGRYARSRKFWHLRLGCFVVHRWLFGSIALCSLANYLYPRVCW